MKNKDNKIVHTTIGVYNSGDMKINGVKPEDLKDHIQYNKDYRPGRAFFVDGKCHNKGYLDTKRVEEYERLFQSDSKYTLTNYSELYV